MIAKDRKERIEEFLDGFQSLRRALYSHSLTERTKRMKNKFLSITPSQWAVLRLIRLAEAITVRDVSRNLGMSSSATTQLVDGLVRNGFVVRKPNQRDRRVVTLSLSPRSRKRMEEKRRQAFQKLSQLFKSLNDKEFNQYYKLNKKIVANLKTK